MRKIKRVINRKKINNKIIKIKKKLRIRLKRMKIMKIMKINNKMMMKSNNLIHRISIKIQSKTSMNHNPKK